jgi:hypothetical protein
VLLLISSRVEGALHSINILPSRSPATYKTKSVTLATGF